MARREKIERLATKVMGWHKHEHEGGGYCWASESGVTQAVSGWNPYENIEDAWKIVERLVQSGYSLFNVSRDSLGWFAEFVRGESKALFGEGNTAQEAICEAALQIND